MLNKNISDNMLVDYICHNLPDKQMLVIDEMSKNDDALLARINFWQESLFVLNNDTSEINPPQIVWDKIETKLFHEKTTASKKKKPSMFTYLLPAFATLSLVFFAIFFFTITPDYKTTIVNNGDVLWEIEGNNKSLSIVSLKNVQMVDMDCIVWVKKSGTNKLIKLGKIPDSGHNAKIRMDIANMSSPINAGDTIIVAMVKSNDNSTILNKKGQYPSAVLKGI